MGYVRRLLVRWYLRYWTRHASLDTRLLGDWCDYRPAHRSVRFVAFAGDRPFGQSCFRHSGALLADAARQDPAVVVQEKDADQEERNRRMQPLVIE